MMKLPLMLIVVAFADLVFSIRTTSGKYSIKAEYFKIRIVGRRKCLGNLGGRPVIQICCKTPGQWWKWGGESGKQILTRDDPTIGLYYDPRDDKMEIRQVDSSNHFDWEFRDGKWYGSDYYDRPIEVWTSGKRNSQPYGANTGDSKFRKELKKWQISLKTFFGGDDRFIIRHDQTKMCLTAEAGSSIPTMYDCLEGNFKQIWYWDGNHIKHELDGNVLTIKPVKYMEPAVGPVFLMNASENLIQAQFKHENGFIKSLWSPNGDEIRVVPYKVISLGRRGWMIRTESRRGSLVGALKINNEKYAPIMKWSLIPISGEEAVWPVAMPVLSSDGVTDSIILYVKYGPSQMTIMWPKY